MIYTFMLIQKISQNIIGSNLKLIPTIKQR